MVGMSSDLPAVCLSLELDCAPYTDGKVLLTVGHLVRKGVV